MANGTSPVSLSSYRLKVLLPADQLGELLAGSTPHSTDSGGCRLAWQQWSGLGKGSPPLLLLHGGFGSWTHWVANLQALRQERTLWTVDLPGLGASGDMPKPWTTRHFAELLLAGWCSLTGEDQPFELAAFSFGAMIAGHLAALSGQRCTRCTLIGASGFGELHRQVPLLAPPGSELPNVAANAIHRENLSRLMLHDAGRIDDLAVYVHGDNLARHRFRSRSMAGSNDLAEILPLIPGHLVGIWGAQDGTAGGAGNIEARRRLFLEAEPEAEFYVLPEVGHWAMYEAPGEINRLLLHSGNVPGAPSVR